MKHRFMVERRVLPILLLMLLLCAAAAADGLSLEPTLLELKPKGKASLTVSGASGKTVWSSSDETVAKVKNGQVTAVAAGECVITVTATAKDGRTGTATARVKVSIPVTGLKLAASRLTLKKGETAELPDITFKPESATSRELAVTSSDLSVVEVNEDGTLTAVGKGNAVVTVETAQTLGKKVSAELKVTVIQPVESIEAPNLLVIDPGGTATLKATALPADADDPRLTYVSADPKVASVTSSGEVHAVGKGSVVITIGTKDGSGVTAECLVRISYQTETLETSAEQDVTLSEGSTRWLPVTTGPASVTDHTLDWESSDESVAVMNGNLLTAVAPGTAKITCRPHDGANLSLMWKVTVEPAVPVEIESVSAKDDYAGESDCLFLSVKNTCAVRTVKSFDFTVTLADEQGGDTGEYHCTWTVRMGKIKPGASEASEPWHWPKLSGLGKAARVGITVTGVLFDSGIRETIPEDRQVTRWFEINS